MRATIFTAVLLLGTTFACSSEDDSVWTETDAGFVLSVQGGIQGHNRTYAYAAADQTLSLSCLNTCLEYTAPGSAFNKSVTLDSGQVEGLRAQLRALQTTTTTRCTLDDYYTGLVVQHPGGTSTEYKGNTNVVPPNCDQPADSSPLLDHERLRALFAFASTALAPSP